MKAENQKKLFDTFPLLYGDRTKSMQVTCMCWGIDCGDGWFDILWELSEKLEPLIEEIRKKNKYGNCHQCGCSAYKHDKDDKCTVIHELPYHVGRRWSSCCIPQWKRDLKQAWFGAGWMSKSRWERLKRTVPQLLKQDWGYTKYRWINQGVHKYTNRFLNFLYDKFHVHYKKPCHCPGYEISYPRASQVKEKFGTLRFYMTSATDEMREHVRKAENKSAKVCEDCGAEGVMREGGWIRTLCNDCEEAYQERRRR